MAFFIPPGNKGNILYTSRHRELTRPVSPQLTRQVPIMDEDEAITFLLRASELELESAELKSYARPIVQELCYLPLAIEQAGRYMGQGNCSIDKFLERFRDHRDNLFLDNVGEEMSKAILAVYTTFDISYKLIEEQELDPSINPNKRIANRSALQILNTFCFFHNEGLMADFVGRAAENKCNRKELVMEYLVADCGDLKSSVPQELLELNRNGKWDSKRFDEGMAILRSYGLVKAGGERGTYSIHSLVFSWIRDRMDKLQRFMYLFTARTLLFDSISFRNTPDHVLHRRKCIPHLEAMLVCFNKFDGYPAVFPESELHEAHEIDKYATILAENRRSIDLVEALRLKSLHIKTAQLGPDSKETLSAMMSLAQTKITQKEYKSAEEYVMSVIEARERLFGLEDLSTCRAKRKLAVIYLHSERYTQAERLTRQIAATVEREHGSNHPLLLDILRTRCQVLWMSGQEAEAVELAERLVNLSVEGLAPGDSGRTGSLSTLAQARHESSDYEQAEELHAKIIKMHEAKYGETSLLALADKVYHAIMLLLHEKVDEGVALCEQVYKALKETAGWNHGVTHQAVRTLLTGYMMQRRFLDVEMLLKECLDIASSIGQRREEEERLLRIISRYLDLTERKGLTYNDYLCKIKGLDGIPEELTARTKEKLLDTGQALTS